MSAPPPLRAPATARTAACAGALLAGLLAIGLLAIGCGAERAPSGPPPSRRDEGVGRQTPSGHARWTVTGRVRLARALPRPPSGAAGGDASPLPAPALDPATLALGGAWAWLQPLAPPGGSRPSGASTDADTPRPGTARISLVNGRYEPYLQVVAPGTGLELANTEPAENDCVRGHLLGPGSDAALLFNVMLAPGSVLPPTDETLLSRPGCVRVTSDCGRTSQAWVLVLGSPRAEAPTGLEGRFRIADVPPGDHELVVWHPPVRAEHVPATPDRTATWRLGPPLRHVQRLHLPAPARGAGAGAGEGAGEGAVQGAAGPVAAATLEVEVLLDPGP